MHGAIIELTTKPLKSEMRVKATRFDKEGIGAYIQWSDYVRHSDSRQQDIEWFTKFVNESCGQDILIYKQESNQLIFKQGFKRQFFGPRFDKVKKLMSDLDLEAFASIKRDNFQLYQLEKAIREPHGFQIFEDEQLEPLDDFIRYSLDDSKDQVYYIGGVLDYHY